MGQDSGQCHWVLFTKSLQYLTFNLMFTLCFFNILNFKILVVITFYASTFQNNNMHVKYKQIWLFRQFLVNYHKCQHQSSFLVPKLSQKSAKPFLKLQTETP